MYRLIYFDYQKLRMAKFKTKLNKWGNSVGINLPKPLRDTFNLESGDDIELEDKEDFIIIRKIKPLD
jgi:AbrB family looped-hinge helix DNA binding protein